MNHYIYITKVSEPRYLIFIQLHNHINAYSCNGGHGELIENIEDNHILNILMKQ